MMISRGLPSHTRCRNCGVRANVKSRIVRAKPARNTWRDWKGDLVPRLASFFGVSVRVTVPNELTSEAELLKFLALSAAELKKIWWFRGRMYQKLDVSKGEGKSRVISAPDRRLKMLQTKVATSLGRIYRPRNPVHGFVDGRSVKTNA